LIIKVCNFWLSFLQGKATGTQLEKLLKCQSFVNPQTVMIYNTKASMVVDGSCDKNAHLSLNKKCVECKFCDVFDGSI